MRVGLDGRDEGGKEAEETNARGALARGGRKAMLAQVAACGLVGVGQWVGRRAGAGVGG